MTTKVEVNCADCGYPRSKHSYNGACYGTCGKFRTPCAPPAPVGDTQTEGCMSGWEVEAGDDAGLVASLQTMDRLLTGGGNIPFGAIAGQAAATITRLTAEAERWCNSYIIAFDQAMTNGCGLAAVTAQRDEQAARIAELEGAVIAVVKATRAYLPPDGIDAQECLNRIIGATDNPTINPIIREIENGRS